MTLARLEALTVPDPHVVRRRAYGTGKVSALRNRGTDYLTVLQFPRLPPQTSRHRYSIRVIQVSNFNTHDVSRTRVSSTIPKPLHEVFYVVANAAGRE
jgi:hypothetical protein